MTRLIIICYICKPAIFNLSLPSLKQFGLGPQKTRFYLHKYVVYLSKVRCKNNKPFQFCKTVLKQTTLIVLILFLIV